MTTPKVSIVIPVFNAEKYLKEALNSLVNQSYKNLEIICVDDGSTDTSPEILQTYKDKDSRIQILSQKNQYAGIARNNGMDHATGDYIMFLDADDVFEKNMVSYLVNRARKYDPDIIVFGYNRFIEQVNRSRPVRSSYKNNFLCSPKEISREIFQQTRSMPWNKFLKTDFIRKARIRYDATKVNNDIFFNLVAVTEASKILFCTKRFINYRINNSSSLQGGINKNPVDFLLTLERIHDELVRRGTYEIYKDSYDSFVLTCIVLHFQRIESYDNFDTIIRAIKSKDILRKLEINETSEVLMSHPYCNTLRSLFDDDTNETLAILLCETICKTVDRTMIDYQIGHKLLQLFHLSY